MASLVSVADGLTPQADYSFLPPTVVAWGFYVGKPSIGAWTVDQVAHLAAHGVLPLPIWTPGDGTDYTRAEAQADAASMLAGLHALGIDDQRWVFLDMERSRVINDLTQATDAANYWCQIMRASGWPRAGWYGPWASSATWRALWTGLAPVSLPDGCLGQQYDHDLAGGRYDISRFDQSILDRGNPMSINGPEHWDPADWAAIAKNLPALAGYDPTHPDTPSVATVLHILEGIRDGALGFNSLPSVQAAVTAAIGRLTNVGPAPKYVGSVSLTPEP